jgi:hypothetical protein
MAPVFSPPWRSHFHNREIYMSIHAMDEIIYVVTEIIGEKTGLVSQRHIEAVQANKGIKIADHILSDPSLFPILSRRSQKSRRNMISRIMNDRYELWNNCSRFKKRNFVWNLHSKKESS